MTWVERQMGAAFNPNKFCDYTGLRLYPSPIASPLPYGGSEWRIAYWRQDGFLKRVRDCTGAELAWIAANPAKFEASQTRFKAWLAGFENN